MRSREDVTYTLHTQRAINVCIAISVVTVIFIDENILTKPQVPRVGKFKYLINLEKIYKYLQSLISFRILTSSCFSHQIPKVSS